MVEVFDPFLGWCGFLKENLGVLNCIENIDGRFG